MRQRQLALRSSRPRRRLKLRREFVREQFIGQHRLFGFQFKLDRRQFVGEHRLFGLQLEFVGQRQLFRFRLGWGGVIVVVNGMCGSSNGQSLASAPAGNLCSAGTASAVSGTGPWTWQCQASNGGTAAFCSALLDSSSGSCSTVSGQGGGSEDFEGPYGTQEFNVWTVVGPTANDLAVQSWTFPNFDAIVGKHTVNAEIMNVNCRDNLDQCVKIVPDPVNPSNHVLWLNSQWDTGSHASKGRLEWEYDTPFSSESKGDTDLRRQPYGTKYTFALRFFASEPIGPETRILQGEPPLGSDAVFPFLQVWVNNQGHLTLMVLRYTGSDMNQWGNIQIDIGPYKVGSWNTLVLHIMHADDSTGFIDTYLNGEKATYHGPTIFMPGETLVAGLKAGPYAWGTTYYDDVFWGPGFFDPYLSGGCSGSSGGSGSSSGGSSSGSSSGGSSSGGSCAPSLLPAGYLSTNGNQTVDAASGDPVRLACVGYSGKPNPAQDIPAMIAAGFNCLRIPYVDATLQSDLAKIDAVVAAATANGFKVIINHQTNEAGTDCDGNGARQANGLWFDSGPGSDGTNGCSVPGTVTAQKFRVFGNYRGVPQYIVVIEPRSSQGAPP